MAPMETQPERTALSWQRTGLGLLAVAGVLAHRAVRDGRPSVLVAAGTVALLGLGVVGGLAPVRYRRLARSTSGGVAAPGFVLAATGAVVALSVLAAVVVLLTPR